jgi:hypothetical protein
VVWISKSNRSALKEKERPGSDAGPFCISLHVDLDDDNCMEVTLSRDQAETCSTSPIVFSPSVASAMAAWQ